MRAIYIGDENLLVPCEYQGTQITPDDYCAVCRGAIKCDDDPKGDCPIIGWDNHINEKYAHLFKVEE